MQLFEFMANRELSDEAMAELIRADGSAIDRSQVNRLRRGKSSPSWEIVARIKAVTGGAVDAESWLLPVPEEQPAEAAE